VSSFQAIRFPCVALGLAGVLLLVLQPAGNGVFADEPDVPDVGVPFDVKAFEAYSLPAGKNADSLYLLAARSLVKHDYKEGGYARIQATETSARQAALLGWREANADARKWLDANARALGIWKSGTARDEAIEVPLDEFDCDSLLPVCDDVRTFVALALLKASQQANEGHSAEAWSWCRATLRASRHLGMYGGVIERLVGADVYRLARDPILNWAAQSNVTRADLRQASADVMTIDAMTAPISRTLKVEYLSVLHSIPLVLANVRKEHPFVAVAMQQSGRPQKMLRVANLYFSNWLANAQRPRWLRKPMADRKVGLFEPDRGSPPLAPARELKMLFAMQLSGLEPNMGVLKVPQIDYALPGMMWLFDTVDRDRVNCDAVIVGLALQLYFREHGRFPAALSELVQAGYLKSIPSDPFGQGEPIHYRLEGSAPDHAVLWSVSSDGIGTTRKPLAGKSDSRFSAGTVFEIKAVRKSNAQQKR
jgi:hypothetical protein